MHIDGKGEAPQWASTELATHSPLTRLPVILSQVHDKAAQQLKQQLQVLFDNADKALFEMADKARSNAQQSLFFEAMRDLRLKRKNIERGFLYRLFKAFITLTQPTATEPTLLGKGLFPTVCSLLGDDVARAQAVNSMVSRVLIRDHRALCHLTTRFNTLSWMRLDEQSNPLGPAMLCEYFLQDERDQGVDIKVKLITLQLFEHYQLRHTGHLYADANQLLIATGVLPNLCAITSDYPQDVPASGAYASQLVGQLFEYISGDRNLSPSLKKLIAQVQQPILRIAQMDQNFFSSDSHPARRLLNLMAQAAIGWDASLDCENDPLHACIEHVVQQLAAHSGSSPEALETVLQNFLVFTHAQRARVEVLELSISDDLCASPQQVPTEPFTGMDEQDHLGLLLVSQLRIGSWIEIKDGQGICQRCKLIAIVEPEGRYVFVNRSGIRVEEKTRGELIAQLRCGAIELLDEGLLFDRALASVIHSLAH